jgi:hypothetical protein
MNHVNKGLLFVALSILLGCSTSKSTSSAPTSMLNASWTITTDDLGTKDAINATFVPNGTVIQTINGTVMSSCSLDWLGEPLVGALAGPTCSVNAKLCP